jgi:HSP20 family protein
MALFRYGRDLGPMNALLRLQEELSRAYESPFGRGLGLLGGGVRPPTNIFKSRTGEDVVIKLEVPGFGPSDITVESRGQTLTVSGKNASASAEATEGAYHRRERVAGEFSRSIQLPREVDPARTTAQCKNGVLTLNVPAREETMPRQISVQGG